jgi:hypothetical protein
MLVKAVDRALAFEPVGRWQSAHEMFEALRAAHEELQSASGATRNDAPGRVSIDVSVTWQADSESPVVDVAFGANRDQAMMRERMRTREIIEGLSGISVVVDPETTLKD